MDSEVLADLVDEVVATGGFDSVTVVRNGHLVLDVVVDPFPSDSTHIIYSATKSVLSTLVAIAIDEGLLEGVDVPVAEILPDKVPQPIDELRASMTVEDLLTMTSGLDCRDSHAFDWRGLFEMWRSDDWVAHVLSLPMATEPGTRFLYCNGVSHALSGIVSRVTGKSASEYADEVLFGPLGITDYEWPEDPNGISYGYSRLELLPQDMVKIGHLILRGGEWDGQQLLSPSWITDATTSHIPATSFGGYGYQWWINDEGWPIALGYAGQYILVIPEQDMVVAFTSGLPGSLIHHPEELTRDYIVEAVASTGPLPPNPDAQQRLATAIREASEATQPTEVFLPDTAAEIDGVRYEYEPEDVGNRWFRLTFGETSALLEQRVAPPGSRHRYPDDGQPVGLDVGLDSVFRFSEAWGHTFAHRGEWLDEETFEIEWQVIGQNERGFVRILFEGDSARVYFWETTFASSTRLNAERAE